MPAFLRVLGGRGLADRYELPIDRPVLIGRGEGCDLRIDHVSLSRLHCSVEFESDHWHLSDCKSTNGTRVGGFRISATLLWPGEVIQIGEIRLEFDITGSAAEITAGDPSGVANPLAGRYFARFELLRSVHTSPRGNLYLARETEKNRHVALKLFPGTVAIDEDARKWFERGMHGSALHPGIVQIYAVGKTEGQAWLSTEWVPGPSLQDLLDRHQKLSPAEVVRIARGLASALEWAAKHQIIHGQIKPSSILIARGGEPKLTGFVRVRAVGEKPLPTDSGTNAADAVFRAPEWFAKTGMIDSRADIYSLGVCLVAMLVGNPPHSDAILSGPLHHLFCEPASAAGLSRPEIPPAKLEAIIAKCLAQAPSGRFQAAHDLFTALAELGDLAPTPITEQRALLHDDAGPTVVDESPSEPSLGSLGELPDPLASSAPSTASTWRRLLKIPKPSNAPAERPWRTLLVTIALVVGIGSVLLFRGRISYFRFGVARKELARRSGPSEPPGSVDIKTLTQKPASSEPIEVPVPSEQLAKALADPERLIVQPGTPLRNISDAVGAAQDGQVIEVASNDALRGEVKLPAKSLTLVANPEFHPVFRNTVRVNGGGTIRLEGFHFEPYLANKPALEVEKMPEKLELAACTFRDTDGVLILVRSTASHSGTRPTLVLDHSFAVGNIILSFTGLPPDLRLEHTCLVVDQTVLDWQLSPGDSGSAAGWGLVLRNNTLVSRGMFHVRLDDQQRPIVALPRTSIQLNDNIFAFPARYPSTFFRWESWQRPDIVQERFTWSGSNNAFSGLGSWSMATTLALSDPAATPQVVLESPDDWQRQWANQVENLLKLPAEFRYAGPPKKIQQISPRDYELAPESRLRARGSQNRPLGANIDAIPLPPPVR